MFNELSLQLYSVRNHMTNAQEIKETFKKLAEIGYTGAQTAGVPAIPFEEFAGYAKDAGIKIVGTHLALPSDVDDIDEYVAIHKTLGTNIAGVGGGQGKTKAEVIAYIEKVNRLAENLAKHGLTFSYHNHSFEFVRMDGRTRMIDLLKDGFDKKNVSFCLDTYWVANAGGDPCKWIEDLAGRIKILHIKDMATRPGTHDSFITEILEGNLNFDSILKVAEETGVQDICVEQDTWPAGFDSIDCVKKSYNNYMARYCNK